MRYLSGASHILGLCLLLAACGRETGIDPDMPATLQGADAVGEARITVSLAVKGAAVTKKDPVRVTFRTLVAADKSPCEIESEDDTCEKFVHGKERVEVSLATSPLTVVTGARLECDGLSDKATSLRDDGRGATLTLSPEIEVECVWHVETVREDIDTDDKAKVISTELKIPGELAVTKVTTDEVWLKWAYEKGNAKRTFEVERSRLAATGFARVATVAGDGTQYTDDDVESGTRYYYRVRTVEGLRVSKYSAVLDATTKTPPPPPPPPQPAPSANAVPAKPNPAPGLPPAAAGVETPGKPLAGLTTISPVKITVSWPAMTADRYVVERAAGVQGFVVVANVTSPTYVDSNCAFAVKYRYRIRAVRGNAISAASAEAAAGAGVVGL